MPRTEIHAKRWSIDARPIRVTIINIFHKKSQELQNEGSFFLFFFKSSEIYVYFNFS